MRKYIRPVIVVLIIRSFAVSFQGLLDFLNDFCSGRCGNGYYSARSAHKLRRPCENVPAESIRPIAKRLEWPDTVIIQPKAEL